MNTVVPTFFAKVLPEAEEKRQRPNDEKDLIIVEPKMLQLIKAFRATRHGRKKGGLHLLKKSSKKRRRAQFEKEHDLAISVLQASRTSTEPDVFKRVFEQDRRRRQL